MYRLHYIQDLPISLEQAWEFFSTPSNLAKITPPAMSFAISPSQCHQRLYAGQLLTYSIRPLWNISMEWVTEIKAVQDQVYFVDEQKFGPYRFWHHEHWFKAIPGGVSVEDIIYYKLPLGILGRMLHDLKIKNDLAAIFAFRKASLEAMFGTIREDDL